MFIVKNSGVYYGPLLAYETAVFVLRLPGQSEVIPLVLAELSGECSPPAKGHRPDDNLSYSAFIDRVKVDTKHALAGIIQECYFARREDRVFTPREIRQIWDLLLLVAPAVESLMHYAELAVADPQPGHLEALRKALWRNRDSDDFDPHYADRFW